MPQFIKTNISKRTTPLKSPLSIKLINDLFYQLSLPVEKRDAIRVNGERVSDLIPHQWLEQLGIIERVSNAQIIARRFLIVAFLLF